VVHFFYVCSISALLGDLLWVISRSMECDLQSILSYLRFFRVCVLYQYLLILGMFHYLYIRIVISLCSLFSFSFQYLPSDWLERHVGPILFVSRRLSPQRPRGRMLLCVFFLVYCVVLLLHSALAVLQYIVIGPVCWWVSGWVFVCVCVCVCLYG